MSGILQRLAGQALRGQESGASRIRSAMSVHAAVPLAAPRDTEVAKMTPPPAPDVPQRSPDEIPASLSEERGPAPNFAAVIRAAEVSGEIGRQVHPAREREARAIPPPALREAPNRHDSHEFPKSPPQPLLDEVNAVRPTPAIAPAAQPVPTLTIAKNSQSEPTEVHVHIGRIEVIAAPEPAAPKSNRTSASRSTLPLADYLARRRQS